MATPAQLAANRANAAHATGPVTVEGKQASSRNAMRHGLTAAQIIAEGEDPAEFEALKADVFARLDPEGAYEATLAAAVAAAQWRHMRIRRAEASWWTLRTRSEQIDSRSRGTELAPDRAAGACLMQPHVQAELRLIMRYLMTAERAYGKAVAAFEQAKNTRPEKEAPPPGPGAGSARTAGPDEEQPGAVGTNVVPMPASDPVIGSVSQKSRAERRADERVRRKEEKRARRQQWQLAA